MPMPNPILKRARTGPPDYDPFPHVLDAEVHFPPSPSLTRTFSAHSAAQYDRTPIQVSPNACALPARGCPGRTYYDTQRTQRSSNSYANANNNAKPSTGRSLHPRAFASAPVVEDDYYDDEDEDVDAERTPTRTSPYIPLPVPPPIPHAPYSYPSSSPNSNSVYSVSPSSHTYSSFSSPTTHTHYPSYLSAPAPPPLVPDLSSESDESDGFASPPPEPSGPPMLVGGKYGHGYAPYAPTPSPYAPPNPYASYAPSSPPQHYQRQSQSPPRHRSRPPPRRPQTPFARSAGGEEDGYEEEDLPRDFSHAGAFSRRAGTSPERERKRESPPRKSRSSSSYSTSPSASTAYASESPPRERKSRPSSTSSGEKPKRSSKSKERKDGKERKESKRASISGLCRSLAGASFRDAEADGCLGGF